VNHALAAAEELAGEGISAEVIDLRTLRPIDYDTVLASVNEDQPLRDGRGRLPGRVDRRPSGSTIMQRAFDYLDAPVDHLHRQGRADALCGEPGKVRC
jgi:pyruvate dehydrogenase E1 component beta subunit